MSTTLIEELEQAAKDADASAIAYAVYAGKVHDAPRKRAVFEEHAARLRQRAAWVRELESELQHSQDTGNAFAGICLVQVKRLTGPIPSPGTATTEGKET